MCNNDIKHHGIKGMRWGVRRTPAQLGHRPAATKKKLFGGVTKKKQTASDKPKELSTEEKKAKILKSRSAKELFDNAHLFNDKELNDAYMRLNLEKNIKNLIETGPNKAEKFVDGAIKWGGKISDLAKNVNSAYVNVSKLGKTLGLIDTDSGVDDANASTTRPKKIKDKKKTDEPETDKSKSKSDNDGNKSKTDKTESNDNTKATSKSEKTPPKSDKPDYGSPYSSVHGLNKDGPTKFGGNEAATSAPKLDKTTSEFLRKGSDNSSKTYTGEVFDAPKKSGDSGASGTKTKTSKTIWVTDYTDLSDSPRSRDLVSTNYSNTTISGLLGSSSLPALENRVAGYLAPPKDDD